MGPKVVFQLFWVGFLLTTVYCLLVYCFLVYCFPGVAVAAGGNFGLGAGLACLRFAGAGIFGPKPASSFTFSLIPLCFIDEEGPIQALGGPE
jgi:hypothetical protein